MKGQVSLQGRSFVFNLLSVILHTFGLVFLGLAFLPTFSDMALLLSVLGAILFLIGLTGIIIFNGLLMMSLSSRWIVGSLLMVSALVKINDPIGFAFKLEEYLQDGALAYRFKVWLSDPSISFDGLQQFALPLAVALCILELIIGVYLLVGGAKRFASYSLLLIMILFSFLTWHTASCDVNATYLDRNTYPVSSEQGKSLLNKSKKDGNIRLLSKTDKYLTFEERRRQPQCVTDCGCFGDALKGSVGRSLLPEESLLKDIWLLYLGIWIFIAQWITKPNSRSENVFFLVASSAVFFTMAWLLDWMWMPFLLIFLFLLALWLKRAGGKFLGNEFGTTVLSSLFGMFLVTNVLLFEPLKDYRPFSVGTNIRQKMNDGVPGKSTFNFVLLNKQTGAEQTFTESEYLNNSSLWDDKKFKFLRRIERVIIPGRLPSISDQFDPFIKVGQISKDESMWKVVADSLSSYENYTAIYERKESGKIISVNPTREKWIINHPDYRFRVKKTIAIDPEKTLKVITGILKEPKVVLLCSERLPQGNWNQSSWYRQISKELAKRKIPFILLTASSRDEIATFKRREGLSIPAFQNDTKGLQMISRSNPSIMVLKYGRVVANLYPNRGLPDQEVLWKVLK